MARPREFDREQVLEKATKVFWSKGFEATSIQDLVDAMGLDRGSIYNTFGDKQGLFLEAIDHYEKKVFQGLIDMLSGTGSVKKLLATFFSGITENATTANVIKGCLMSNSAVERGTHDRATAEKVSCALRGLEDAFHGALKRAQDSGEISAKKDTRALARHFLNTMQGMAVMIKAGSDKAVLQDVAKVALSVL